MSDLDTAPPAPITRQALGEQQQAAADVVTSVLRSANHEFVTAGELAALMAALPADTPVSVAETVHVDPDLPPGAPTVNTAVASPVTLLEAEPVNVIEDDGRLRQFGRMIPGIELSAVIVAEGRPVPETVVPYPHYERALDALGRGDVLGTLAAHTQLLRDVADLLTDSPSGPDGEPETVPSWIPDEDSDLREALTVEAERLRQSATRLDALAVQIAERELRHAAEDEADAEYERRVAELSDAPTDGYPQSWITTGLPPLDDRIDDWFARDAYLADGHADEGQQP